MLKQYTALSIVAPNAERIAKKIKLLKFAHGNLMKLRQLVQRIGLKEIWLGLFAIFVRLTHRFKLLPSENFIVLN